MPALYRFTTLERVVEIVQRNELTLVRPSAWADPYEGFVYAAAKRPEGRRRIAAELAKLVPHPTAVGGFLGLLTALDVAYFGQCWTKTPEDDALWKSYSHDNQSVRIEVDQDAFAFVDGVSVDDVIYVEHIDLEAELRRLLSDDGRRISGGRALLTKRAAFHYENEVRIIAMDPENIDRANRPPPVFFQALQAALPPEEFAAMRAQSKYGPPQMLLRKSLAHVPHFIKSLMLHPHAPDELDVRLKEYCRQHGIEYLGRSQLYTFRI